MTNADKIRQMSDDQLVRATKGGMSMNCTGKNCIMQYDKVDPATCPCVPYCPQATPPKTNADKIRQMADAELAIWIVHKTDGNGFDDYEEAFTAWLEWLKEEAE